MDRKTILIVGCGFSGAGALSKLSKANLPLNIVVLEASDRIGGRVHTQYADHQNDEAQDKEDHVELGATWFHKDLKNRNPLEDIAVEKQLLEAEYPPCNRARSIFLYENGDRMSLDEMYTGLKYYASNLIRASTFYKKGLPGFCDASTSVEEYVKGQFRRQSAVVSHPAEEKEKLDAIFNGCIMREAEYCGCNSLSELSLFYFGSREEMLGNQPYVAKGYIEIINEIIQGCENKITFQTEVVKIKYDVINPLVEVITSNGTVYKADHVIFTGSLGYMKATHRRLFEPCLSANKCRAIERLGFGTVNKIFLQFENVDFLPDSDCLYRLHFCWSLVDGKFDRCRLPWWVKQIVSATVVKKPVSDTLMLWVTAGAAKHMETLSLEQVETDCLALLQHFIPGKVVPKPIKVYRSTWYTNPFIKGSFTYIPIGATNFDMTVLAEPIKNAYEKPTVCFAGEATSSHHFSTTHGAYLTGVREADRIIHYYKRLELPDHLHAYLSPLVSPLDILPVSSDSSPSFSPDEGEVDNGDIPSVIDSDSSASFGFGEHGTVMHYVRGNTLQSDSDVSIGQFMQDLYASADSQEGDSADEFNEAYESFTDVNYRPGIEYLAETNSSEALYQLQTSSNEEIAVVDQSELEFIDTGTSASVSQDHIFGVRDTSGSTSQTQILSAVYNAGASTSQGQMLSAVYNTGASTSQGQMLSGVFDIGVSTSQGQMLSGVFDIGASTSQGQPNHDVRVHDAGALINQDQVFYDLNDGNRNALGTHCLSNEQMFLEIIKTVEDHDELQESLLSPIMSEMDINSNPLTTKHQVDAAQVALLLSSINREQMQSEAEVSSAVAKSENTDTNVEINQQFGRYSQNQNMEAKEELLNRSAESDDEDSFNEKLKDIIDKSSDSGDEDISEIMLARKGKVFSLLDEAANDPSPDESIVMEMFDNCKIITDDEQENERIQPLEGECSSIAGMEVNAEILVEGIGSNGEDKAKKLTGATNVNADKPLEVTPDNDGKLVGNTETNANMLAQATEIIAENNVQGIQANVENLEQSTQSDTRNLEQSTQANDENLAQGTGANCEISSGDIASNADELPCRDPVNSSSGESFTNLSTSTADIGDINVVTSFSDINAEYHVDELPDEAEVSSNSELLSDYEDDASEQAVIQEENANGSGSIDVQAQGDYDVLDDQPDNESDVDSEGEHDNQGGNGHGPN